MLCEECHEFSRRALLLRFVVPYWDLNLGKTTFGCGTMPILDDCNK